MSDEMIDTVFLVGAGAQKNSWHPVIKAIASCPIKGIGDPAKVTCSESATSFFGTFVNYRRHLHLVGRDPGVAPSMRRRARKAEAVLANGHSVLNACIATKLRQEVDAGTIKLRPQFLQLVAEYWGKGSVAFLTTNWDPLLENELRRRTGKKPRLGYLHGNSANPNLMLLPGEIVAETYRKAADRKRMQKRLISMWNIIEHTRRLVIYGHSVSAIEAELRVMLCMGFSSPHSGKIVIVSRRRDAQAVRQRVRALIPPGRRWKVHIKKLLN